MRYTEYHAGVAVIKDKALLKEAMAKLAKLENLEKQEGKMNILEKILEEIEKRVNFRKNLVGYEKENGTIMDVERNRGAMEELIIVIKIINSCIDEAEEGEVAV